uniref:DNA-directed RNA polymerase I subunit RPA1-like n=1 Tax=Styela clava TaxID=7725 RepID=UPI0019399DD1|nr:DNA-directed RNA polymerase I subunit RPA1-like [Styela clava]
MVSRWEIPSKVLDGMKFTCYSSDEIRALSVKEVTNPQSLNFLLHPTENGLYDPVFGPPTRLDDCKTCGLGSSGCPGHLGHIELPIPIYQPVFFKTLLDLLRAMCLKCHRFLVDRSKRLLLIYKLRAINKGMLQLVNELEETFYKASQDFIEQGIEGVDFETLADELEKVYSSDCIDSSACEDNNKPNNHGQTYFSRNANECRRNIVKDFFTQTHSKKKCDACASVCAAFRSENSKIFVVASKDKTKETTQYYMTPIVAREHISELWNNDRELLANIYGAFHDASFSDKKHSATDLTNPESGDLLKTPERSSAIDVLFLTVIPVPPSKYRPVMAVNGKKFENPQTAIYSKIILDCILLRTLMVNLNEEEPGLVEDVSNKKINVRSLGNDEPVEEVKISDRSLDMLKAIPGKTKAEKLENCWDRLQQHVNMIFDSESGRSSLPSSEQCPGIKQKLEKKAGLFRKNMMGKRVNYAARSVISPDPYIATHEIGVPLCFASKLTYPTPVTPWNVRQLREHVINGPDAYPGATIVVQEDGSKILLKADNPRQRLAIAKQLMAPQSDTKKRKPGLKGIKTVMRYMQNGDVMLLNRQPTLHKGSIMAHKVRVLPGEKTLRLHYANCKSYNADFDGDEMNAHFPQNELCRAEAFELMSTNSQYLAGKDGKPLSGLIQDHMVAGVHMSIRGRYFTKEQYYQLTYNALMHIPRKIKLLPPTILKPEKLWTGKQIFSTILLNITPTGSPLLYLQGSSKIRYSDWIKENSRAHYIKPKELCESEVVIRESQLLCGVLDKNHYGASEYGLVHAMYELYGCKISGELLTCLARLFTAFLQQYRGFSLGVEDILVTAPADSGRKKVIKKTLNSGQSDLAAAVGLSDENDVEAIASKMQNAHISKITEVEDGLAVFDHAIKKTSNDVNDRIAKYCTGNGLNKTFPDNNLQLMVLSGAKGGAVNCMQISCLLGQIELEGRRPPLMCSGRSLPSFRPYNITLRAGGFISQRFLTGIRPQEYFYHCMAGREGLVDTAVKTSRSGYLQRCLIKHLEGIVLAYDLTVRDSDGSVMQFFYGEDGLDIGKQSYLNTKQHQFLIENFKAESKLLPSYETIESTCIDTTKAEKMWRKYNRKIKRKKKAEKKIRKERGERVDDTRKSPFLQYSLEHPELSKSKIMLQWRNLTSEQKEQLEDKVEIFKNPDPIFSIIRPDMNYGSMSETFRKNLEEYLKTNPDNLPEKKKRKNKVPTLEKVKAMLSLKYQRSLCQPGEAVGLIAAQSIGEPSTQMTLNTFHFAGRGEMNVTLGIPRLREILMTASKHIKTPQVIVPVLPGKEKHAKKLQKMLSSVELQQVLNKIHVQEHLDVDSKTAGHRSRQSKIILELLPEKQFAKETAIRRPAILGFIEKTFIPALLSSINQQIKRREQEEMVFSQKKGRSNSNEDSINAEPDEDIGEEPTTEPESKDKVNDEDDNDDDDEAFDQDDAKKGKNKQDFEEEEEEEDEADAQEVDLEELPQEFSDLECILDKTVCQDYQERVSKVKQMSVQTVCVLDYSFDAENSGWCKIIIDMPLKAAQLNIVSIVEHEAKTCYVRKISGISRCVLQQNPQNSEEKRIATEGINFYKLFNYGDILDLRRLQCNCVHSIEVTYGVEAAVRVIQTEVANVFGAYGIQVNKRHLSLVADYLCFSGKYNGFNRAGIDNCASPLQQMTYESTVTFLRDAALAGRWDSLQSPSARIVAGQIVKTGTGCVNLRIPLLGF